MLPHSLFSLTLLAAPQALGATALFLVGGIFLTAVFLNFLPELTRRDIFFAVTVYPDYRRSVEARLSVRRFRYAVWIHTFVALSFVSAGVASKHLLVPLIGIFWQVIGATIAFLRARRQVLPHATVQSPRREAALVRRSPGAIYWLLQIGPFAILTSSILYLRAHWQSIPARFPIHWGLNGEPNGWSNRSFAGVYGPALIGFSVCLFIALFSYGVVHWTRQIRSTGADAAAETRFRRIQLAALVAVQYFMAWIFSGLPFTALGPHPQRAPNVTPFLLGTFAFVAVLYAILIHTGQGGANLMAAGSDSDILGAGAAIGDRTPEECWKAGVFYVNANDPALMVEKRFGIGYTLNFGRPGAWFLAAAILAVAVVPLVIAFLSVR